MQGMKRKGEVRSIQESSRYSPRSKILADARIGIVVCRNREERREKRAFLEERNEGRKNEWKKKGGRRRARLVRKLERQTCRYENFNRLC